MLWDKVAGKLLNTENKIVIARAGAIEPLAKLSSAETPGERESAARALRSLAANAGNQIAIARIGATAPLVKLLSAATPREREPAAVRVGIPQRMRRARSPLPGLAPQSLS